MATTDAMNWALGGTGVAMPMQQQIISDLESQDAAASQADIASTQQVAEAYKHRAETEKPVLEDIENFKGHPASDYPADTRKPIPDFEPTKIKPEDMKQDFSFLLTMSLLFGAVGRRGFDGAMTSMNGALEGYRQGDKDRFDRELATYKEHLQAIKDQNQKYHEDLKEIWDSDEHDLNMKVRKSRALAAINNNEIDAATWANKPVAMAHEQISKRLNSAKEQLVKMEDNREKMQTQFGHQLIEINMRETGANERMRTVESGRNTRFEEKRDAKAPKQLLKPEQIKAAERALERMTLTLDDPNNPMVTGGPGWVRRIWEGTTGNIARFTGEKGLAASPKAQNFQSDLATIKGILHTLYVGGGHLSAANQQFLGDIMRGNGLGDSPEAVRDSVKRIKEMLDEQPEKGGSDATSGNSWTDHKTGITVNFK